jgi:hypothetical protein
MRRPRLSSMEKKRDHAHWHLLADVKRRKIRGIAFDEQEQVWREWGTREEVRHHLKQVWHVLVHYGALTNSPEPRRWTAESALSDQATCGAPAIRDALDAALPRSALLRQSDRPSAST